MMQTILTIVLSAGLGIGSTLLVQTVILTPAPVIVAACPEQPSAAAQELLEKALEPLPVENYVPQGRALQGMRIGGDGPWN